MISIAAMPNTSIAFVWISRPSRQIGILEDGRYAFCMRDNIRERTIKVIEGKVEGMNDERKLTIRKVDIEACSCFRFDVVSHAAVIVIPLEVEQGEQGFSLTSLLKRYGGEGALYFKSLVHVIDDKVL